MFFETSMLKILSWTCFWVAIALNEKESFANHGTVILQVKNATERIAAPNFLIQPILKRRDIGQKKRAELIANAVLGQAKIECMALNCNGKPCEVAYASANTYSPKNGVYMNAQGIQEDIRRVASYIEAPTEDKESILYAGMGMASMSPHSHLFFNSIGCTDIPNLESIPNIVDEINSLLSKKEKNFCLEPEAESPSPAAQALSQFMKAGGCRLARIGLQTCVNLATNFVNGKVAEKIAEKNPQNLMGRLVATAVQTGTQEVLNSTSKMILDPISQYLENVATQKEREALAFAWMIGVERGKQTASLSDMDVKKEFNDYVATLEQKINNKEIDFTAQERNHLKNMILSCNAFHNQNNLQELYKCFYDLKFFMSTPRSFQKIELQKLQSKIDYLNETYPKPMAETWQEVAKEFADAFIAPNRDRSDERAIMMVGPPGVGKTEGLKELANILDVTLIDASLNGASLLDLFGTGPNTRSIVAEKIKEARTRRFYEGRENSKCLIISADELDTAWDAASRKDQTAFENTLLKVLLPTESEFILPDGEKLDLRCIKFLALANKTPRFRNNALKDRFRDVLAEPPGEYQREIIAKRVLAKVISDQQMIVKARVGRDFEVTENEKDYVKLIVKKDLENKVVHADGSVMLPGVRDFKAVTSSYGKFLGDKFINRFSDTKLPMNLAKADGTFDLEKAFTRLKNNTAHDFTKGKAQQPLTDSSEDDDGSSEDDAASVSSNEIENSTMKKPPQVKSQLKKHKERINLHPVPVEKQE